MNDFTTSYAGPERRKEQRRKNPDRRALIRFEAGKEPRRKNNGRRKGEATGLWGVRAD